MRTPRVGGHYSLVSRSWDMSPDELARIFASLNNRFPACLAFTLDWEDGYVDDPHDPGGCTNMGITRDTLSDWRGSKVNCDQVAALTSTEAGLIYAANYWRPVWGEKVELGLNLQLFDFGVNAGPSRAIKTLQAMVESPEDGIMGPNTLEALGAYLDTWGVEAAIRDYAERRDAYYRGLSDYEYFGDGWTARTEDCLASGIELAAEGQAGELDPRPGHDPAGLWRRVTRLEAWAASFGG